MRIAIATENGAVSAHFGHCEGFTVYDTEGGKVTDTQYIANPGHQPGVLPAFLKQAQVDVVIAGGMGERAQSLFAQNDIRVVAGAEGSLDKAIGDYLAGALVSKGDFCKEHSHAHDCGGH